MKSLIYLSLILYNVCFCTSEQFNDSILLGDIIIEAGYPYENHTVLTEDGYFLGLSRVPLKKGCTKLRGTILFGHGIMNNADHFFLLGPQRSIGYMLADRCYDLWLINNRGTRYSMGHVNRSSEHWEYWSWSLDELARYDLKANLDYVLNHTLEKVHFIGFSQACNYFLMLMATFPNYQAKILSAHLIAPPGFMSGYTYYPPWLPKQVLLAVSKVKELVSFQFPGPLYHSAAVEVCWNMRSPVCGVLVEAILDVPFEKEEWRAWAARYPDQMSFRIVGHFAQFYMAGKMQKYDYGVEENLERYGSESPPKYDLETVNVPIYAYYANEDLFSPAGSVKPLLQILPNVKLDYGITRKEWSHGDFFGGNLNLTELLYQHIFRSLDNY